MDDFAWIVAIGALVLLVILIGKGNGTDTSQTQVADDGSGIDLNSFFAGQFPLDPIPDTSGGDVNTSKLDAFARGVFVSEGTKPGALNDRNNNPGNLKFAGQPGAIGQDASGFAIFPDFGTGFKALENQLAKYARVNPDWTLLQAMRHYLGMDPNADVNISSEGNAGTKAQTVADTIGDGVTPTTTLRDILGV